MLTVDQVYAFQVSLHSPERAEGCQPRAQSFCCDQATNDEGKRMVISYYFGVQCGAEIGQVWSNASLSRRHSRLCTICFQLSITDPGGVTEGSRGVEVTLSFSEIGAKTPG